MVVATNIFVRLLAAHPQVVVKQKNHKFRTEEGGGRGRGERGGGGGGGGGRGWEERLKGKGKEGESQEAEWPVSGREN